MKRLLLVDDDPDVLESLAMVLAPHFEVALAGDGHEGLRRLQTERFDVVLLDVMMPVMDGEAVLAAMKAGGLDVPVVLGSALPDVHRLAARHGVDWIGKPYDVRRLVAKLAQVAGR